MEDQADRPGAEVGGALGVVEVRDAADLDAGHATYGRRQRPYGSGKGQALVRRLSPPCGASRESSDCGRLPSSTLDGLAVVAAEVLDLDLVARLAVEDRVGHVRVALDVLAVDLDDDVAADTEALADLGPAGAQAGLVGGTAVDDVLDQRALVDRQVQVLRELLGDRRGRDAEVGALDLAVLLELGNDLLGGVDRDREADADGAVRAAGRDLRVDADRPRRARRSAGRRSCPG